jgi:hypothetical protein
MSELVPHILFFLAVSVPIVVMGAFFSESRDGPALRSVPRRYAIFVLSCAAVAGLMLFAEFFFASLD